MELGSLVVVVEGRVVVVVDDVSAASAAASSSAPMSSSAFEHAAVASTIPTAKAMSRPVVAAIADSIEH